MNRKNIPISDVEDQQAANATEEQVNGTKPEGFDEEIEMLAARVRELEQENEGLREQRLRAIADLDNARRRAQEDVLKTVQYANADLLKKILPILDDFERSIEHGTTAREFESFFTGVAMIRDKVKKTLEEIGVKRMETVGQEFDVELHEALMRQPSELPEGTVVAELEPGYLYKDKVIRHARVIVSAGSE